MDKPKIKQDPLYQLLRQEDIKAFNEQRDTLDTSELKNGDYRGRDLRNMNARGLDFSNATSATRTCPASTSAPPTSRARVFSTPSCPAPTFPLSSPPRRSACPWTRARGCAIAAY
jgi:hypothetical protein